MRFRRRDLYYLTYGMLTFLLIGIFWWRLSYEELNMENAIVMWSIIIFLGSLLVRWLLKLSPKKIILSSMISLIAVVAVRIIMDKAENITTHNLLVIELFVAGVFALLSSGAGVFIGGLVKKGKDDEESASADLKTSDSNKPDETV